MTSTKSKIKQTDKPPVVVVMGHIDHGKSTLLDYIRKSNTVAGEAGGITQHLSAYEVVHEDKDERKRTITFLDTPGHVAFTKMRYCGSCVSDVAILIVSAEEGPKAQTLEAWQSIKNADIPYVVAINKIDRPNANVEKTKQNLAEHEIFIEGYGGKIPSVNISAKTGYGIPELLDLILLLADMEELKTDPQKQAVGFILETNLDAKTGTMATAVIKDGTLKVGDFVLVGNISAKIKKLENFLGQSIKQASASSPVKIYGFSQTLDVAVEFSSFATKKELTLAEKNQITDDQEKTIDQDNKKISGNILEIPLVIKADTVGTLEAVRQEVVKLGDDKICPRLISFGLGNISENDLKIVSSSANSIILGFHVGVDRSAIDLAERYGIAIQTFDIIYKLSEWLEEELLRRRPKVTVEKIIGRAKIIKVFGHTKDRQVVGGQVTEGSLSKNDEVKIIRRDNQIGLGKVIDMQEQKLPTKEVLAGNQFGSMIEAKISLAPGDILEAFKEEIE
jgi:translation initiation factor IF-2